MTLAYFPFALSFPNCPDKAVLSLLIRIVMRGMGSGKIPRFILVHGFKFIIKCTVWPLPFFPGGRFVLDRCMFTAGCPVWTFGQVLRYDEVLPRLRIRYVGVSNFFFIKMIAIAVFLIRFFRPPFFKNRLPRCEWDYSY